ncbi:MAG: DNA mismatch repair endonuclease MutL [Chloroflexota bacterium]
MKSQPNRIRILPPELANRIAAGEVVERPASVVKELIENSLDAGATKISVEIQEGGLSLVRVSDDGHGITRDDVPLALERFATSKIQTAGDLEAIRTLGFRGEALSSIAAVAQLQILTRTQEELEGAHLSAHEGSLDISPAASPVGTSVTVRDLFYNTPARRKFLKSSIREGDLVRKTVVRYALARPEVAFRLVTNDRESLVALQATPLERLGVALGREVAAEMIEIHWQAGELRVSGHIGGPAVGRSNRQGQFFILNGRPIRSGLLAVMLERPYAGRLPPGRHPVAVVRIDMNPRDVDVNVHPRKTEVNLAQERAVYQAVLWAVEAALSPFPRTEHYPNLDWTLGLAQDWPFSDVPIPPGITLQEADAAYVVSGGLRVLGQLRNTYIIAQGSEGLAVIDQHAAHEQVLFETLLQSDLPASLEPPVQLELTPREAERLSGSLDLLADLGLEIEPFGKNSFLVRTMPAALVHTPAADLIAGLLEELERDWHLDEERLRERIVAKAACTAAVKAGDMLAPETMQDLLDDLLTVWSPATCPHGRPAFITLSIEELERRFLRR